MGYNLLAKCDINISQWQQKSNNLDYSNLQLI